jgi:1,2-diacylglycerol 3-alpha-glucosyltransferase
MKIAVFTDYFFPELGGIQDSIAVTTRSLGLRGHSIDIHAPRYGASDYRRGNATVREPDLGTNVRIHRHLSLPFPSSTRQSRVALPSPLILAALSGRARPDIIHTHSFFGIGLEAVLAGAVLGIPVVGTNHTTIAGFGPHIPVSVERATAYVMWYYNRCDQVTAPSRSVFEELGLERLQRPQRVVSNPIDIGLFKPAAATERQALRGRFGLPGPTISYAGRLGPEKNIEVILHAVAALHDQGIAADLVIAGHGAHEPVLRALAAELRIGERVRFLGTLAPEDLVRLLQISDIFAMLSTSETQSMALLQAMSCGVAVVAANSRALPEFVSPDKGVLVEPHEPARLAVAFSDLLGSPDRRCRLGTAGRRSVERYGVETVTDEWEMLYRSVLDRGPSRERAKGDQLRGAGV